MVLKVSLVYPFLQITVSQRMSATEIITGCDTRNKYDMYQHESQVLFTAREESDCIDRCFCGPLRYCTESVAQNIVQKYVQFGPVTM